MLKDQVRQWKEQSGVLVLHVPGHLKEQVASSLVGASSQWAVGMAGWQQLLCKMSKQVLCAALSFPYKDKPRQDGSVSVSSL